MLEDDWRLNAYLEFKSTPEYISTEGDVSSQEKHDSSADIHSLNIKNCLIKLTDADNTDETSNRTITVIEAILNSTTYEPLYKSIEVHIKVLSRIHCQILDSNRQKALGIKLKKDKIQQETNWATTEESAIEKSVTIGETLSFKDVWEDIQNLKITKEFCMYLKDNPDLVKPKYLVDVGFFKNVLRTPNKSLKSTY